MKPRTIALSLLIWLPTLLLAQPKEVIDAYNLNQAIGSMDMEKVKKMIAEAYDVNYQYNGRSALHTACDKDLLEISKVLIEAGADVNVYSEEGIGRTPLQFVTGDPMQDLPELAALLLQNGADPNRTLDADQAPLFQSIHLAHVESVKVLLEHGASIDMKNSMDQNPLDYINHLIGEWKGDATTEADWKKIQAILSKK